MSRGVVMFKKGSVALVIFGFVAVIAIVLMLLSIEKGSVTGNTQLSASGCFDSDNGKNYETRGSIGVGTRSFDDTCLRFASLTIAGNSNFVKEGLYLAEGYCQNENKTSVEVYTCPNGCVNGICVETDFPVQ